MTIMILVVPRPILGHFSPAALGHGIAGFLSYVSDFLLLDRGQVV